MQIHYVNAARKDYICNQCGKVIEAGTPYIYWKVRNSSVKRWHDYHKEKIPRSELTSSPYKKRVFLVKENLQDLLESQIYNLNKEDFDKNLYCDTLIKLLQIIFEEMGEVEDVSESYECSADNLAKYFGETTQVEHCRKSANALKDWVFELKTIFYEFEDMVNRIKKIESDDDFKRQMTLYINEILESMDDTQIGI